MVTPGISRNKRCETCGLEIDLIRLYDAPTCPYFDLKCPLMSIRARTVRARLLGIYADSLARREQGTIERLARRERHRA